MRTLGSFPGKPRGRLALLAALALCPLSCEPRKGPEAQKPTSETVQAKLRFDLKGHDGPVSSVTFAPGGKILASNGRDGALMLWDVDKGVQQGAIRFPRKLWSAVAFTPDGQTLATGELGEVRLWDVATLKQTGNLPGNRYLVGLITTLADQQTMVTGDLQGTVRFWDLKTRKEWAARRADVGYTYCLAITSDGKIVAATEHYSGHFLVLLR